MKNHGPDYIESNQRIQTYHRQHLRGIWAMLLATILVGAAVIVAIIYVVSDNVDTGWVQAIAIVIPVIVILIPILMAFGYVFQNANPTTLITADTYYRDQVPYEEQHRAAHNWGPPAPEEPDPDSTETVQTIAVEPTDTTSTYPAVPEDERDLRYE